MRPKFAPVGSRIAAAMSTGRLIVPALAPATDRLPKQEFDLAVHAAQLVGGPPLDILP